MDLLDKMATYVRVIESGSFSAAAKHLKLTSGAVSRQIAALDHVYATPERQSGAGGDHYRAQRAALLDQLVAVQAVEDRDTAT